MKHRASYYANAYAEYCDEEARRELRAAERLSDAGCDAQMVMDYKARALGAQERAKRAREDAAAWDNGDTGGSQSC